MAQESTWLADYIFDFHPSHPSMDEVGEQYPTVEEFLNKAGFIVEDTGGGCLCFWMQLPREEPNNHSVPYVPTKPYREILITLEDGVNLPFFDEDIIMIGVHDFEQVMVDCQKMSWKQFMGQWI